MRRAIALGALLAVGGLSMASAGLPTQPANQRRVQMEVMGYQESLYLLSSDAGNWMALVDDDAGVVLIGAQFEGWIHPLLDAVQAVTVQPVTTLVHTHAHATKTDGTTELSPVVQVVSHDHAVQHMTRPPVRTVTDKLSLLEGDNRIDLYYFGPGHTGGDLIVVFPAKGLAYTSDLFVEKAAPIIDRASGGSGVAYPETLAKALAEIRGVTKLVTGGLRANNRYSLEQTASGQVRMTRGPGGGTIRWDDLREYAEFNRAFLAAAQQGIREGKTADVTAATLTLPEKYKSYSMERAPANVRAIYEELGK